MEYVLTPYCDVVHPFAWWEGAFSSEELDFLQLKAKTAKQRANVGGGVPEEELKKVRRSNIYWMGSSPETEWVFKRLAHVVSSLNAQFYHFDLTGFGESIQLTNYDGNEQGMYGWHQDSHGNLGPSRKLSIVMQLSDPADYEGGDLQLLTGEEPISIEKKRGLIVAFPSFTVHQVTPVTKGTRQSLVAWIIGPRFR